MKILHLIDSGGFYGAERVILDLMLEQRDLGHAPVLGSLTSNPSKKKAIEARAELFNLPVVTFKIATGPDFTGFNKVLKWSRDNSVNLLHCHGYKPNILAASIPRSLRRIPALCTLHGWTNTRLLSKMTLYEWIERKLLRFMDAVVLVNRNMLDDDRIINSSIPPEKIHVINNGIWITHSKHQDPATQNLYNRIQEFKQDSILIGSVGRLSHEKGYDYLLKAFGILRNQDIDARLVILGDGPRRSELESIANTAGISDRILFAGYCDNAADYFNLFDIYAISSLTEGLPITLLEAMVSGIPIVATNVGGIPDVVKHGESALLVKSEDVVALAESILKLINDESFCFKITTAAKDIAYTRFSSKDMAMKYQTLYNLIT